MQAEEKMMGSKFQEAYSGLEKKKNFGCDLNKDLDGIQSSNNNCFKLTNALY